MGNGFVHGGTLSVLVIVVALVFLTHFSTINYVLDRKPMYNFDWSTPPPTATPHTSSMHTAARINDKFFRAESEKYLLNWGDLSPRDNKEFLNDFNWWPEFNFTRSTKNLTKGDVGFIVTTGSCCVARAMEMMNTWAAHIDRRQFLLISDEENAELGSITTANLSGKPTWADAQERPFEALRLIRDNEEYRYFLDFPFVVFIDDDTWLNYFALVTYLSEYDPAIPVLMGNLFSHTGTFFSGGTGMIFSRSALRRLVDEWDNPEYPLCEYHQPTEDYLDSIKDNKTIQAPALDVALSYCARELGVHFIRQPFMYQRFNRHYRRFLYKLVSAHYTNSWMYELSYLVAANCSNNHYVIDCWFPLPIQQRIFHPFMCKDVPKDPESCLDYNQCKVNSHHSVPMGCNPDPSVVHPPTNATEFHERYADQWKVERSDTEKPFPYCSFC